MVEIIRIINILLPKYTEDTSVSNFKNFLSWKFDKRTLDDIVIDSFKEGFAKNLDYSEDNLPTEKVILQQKIGGVEFDAIITPTHKRPSYEEVFTSFDNYLNLLLKQYKRNILRRGVLTIENEPYIILSEVISELNKLLKLSLKGKEWFKIELEPKFPKDLLEKIPDCISVVLNFPYGALNEPNARIYFESNNLFKEGEKRTNIFKNFLLEYSIKLLGYEPKEITMIPHVFGEITFIHQLEPRIKVNYGNMWDALMKEAPKILTVRSKIGDLVLAKMIKTGRYGEGFLKEKGLVDNSFMRDYNPIIRENDVYVKLEGVIKRLKLYKAEFTKNIIEQNVYFKPNLIINKPI